MIDTGEGRSSWSKNLSTVLASEKATVSDALITHWHPDHVGGIDDLRSLCPEVQIYKHVSPHKPVTAIQHMIIDRQIFMVDGVTLKAFHCPGHTTDHMSFVLQEEDAMFTGDNVLGHGTTVFEDLAVYLDSLSRMRNQFNGKAYPGHGEMIEDGPGKINEYIIHRQQREDEIIQSLGSIGEGATVMEVVQVVYQDVPEELHIPASGGVVQVLRKLESEKKVARRGERWSLSRNAAL